MALDWVRAEYVETVPNGRSRFRLQRTETMMLSPADFYGPAGPLAPGELASGALPDAGEDVALGYLGVSYAQWGIEGRLAPAGTTYDTEAWQSAMAATQIMSTLNNEIVNGPSHAGPTPIGFAGLSQLIASAPATSIPRLLPAQSDIEENVANALLAVTPHGRSNTGDAAHCLIGNDDLIRTMMKSPAGQTGASGWRVDARTEMIVYHFQGIPVYRAAIGTHMIEPPATTRMYAANLGPTGLQFVYGYGSIDTFGLEADHNCIDPTSGKRHTLLHGAFGLVLWEWEGLAAVDGIEVTEWPSAP